MGRLCRAFRRGASQPGAPAIPDEELEPLLERAASAARQAWPDLEVTAEELVAYGGERARKSATAAQIEALRWDDLLLCCACTREDRAALLALEKMVTAAARQAAQVYPLTDFHLEVRQELWCRLLLKTAQRDRPRLLDYAGRGPLPSWLRVISARTALNLARGRTPAIDPEQSLEDRPGSIDLELHYVQLTHHDQFVSCFREAFAALDPRARTVLRLHLVDAVGLEAIAQHYRVNRSSVTRWISQARDAVVGKTRGLLEERAGVSRADLDSLVRALKSNLNLSISQLLPAPDRSSEEDTPGDPSIG